MESIHQFKIEGIEGEEIDFARFKGKKIIVVNVASECGYTPQYQQLQELYQEFQDKLVIVGFPCNDFGGQEPGSNEQIREFCTRRYGVTFPLSAKVSVKGAAAHPVYQWLARQERNGSPGGEVRWNFHKYLLDENGQLVKHLPSSAGPFDDDILEWVAA